MGIFRRSPDELREIERRLGYRFRDRELLALALTHRSYANEQGLEGHYERLEFLGDAVLELVTADWLYRRNPEGSEGDLSKTKSFLVSEPVLAGLGEELGLGAAMRLGVGEERSGGREKPSLLADAVEAVLGAMYLDGGLDVARTAVVRLLGRVEQEDAGSLPADAKSALQERLQGDGRPLPRYRLVASDGPDHARTFTIEVEIEGERLGVGSGGSKKTAEQQAAREALERLDL